MAIIGVGQGILGLSLSLGNPSTKRNYHCYTPVNSCDCRSTERKRNAASEKLVALVAVDVTLQAAAASPLPCSAIPNLQASLYPPAATPFSQSKNLTTGLLHGLPNSLIPHNTSHAPPQYSKKKTSNGSFQLLSTTSKLSAIQCSSSSSSGGLLAAPPTSLTNGWAAFADKVSGEWDGFGADFTEQGKAMELPECVVPEAYREWEVKVFDWLTQCPTLAHSSHFSFDYNFIRLLPTVGCEADAATRYSVDHRTITSSSSSSSSSSCTAFAYHPTTGSYVAAWAATSTLELELEHCLIDPRDRESRVRIIQVLRLLRAPTPTPLLKLQTVKVFREQWYGPFRGGDQLGGCAIRDSAFASTPPLDASQIIGVWEGPIATATFTKNVIPQQLNECSTMVTVRNEAPNLVLLPKQLWCCLKDTEISGETCCEAGWLLDKGSTITSSCIFSKTGELKQVAIAYQHATPESVPQ